MAVWWVGLIGWLGLMNWAGLGWAGDWQTGWQSGWYLDGGGYWAARVQVTVTNRTDRPMEGLPVPVPIGPKQGEANLVGAEARSIRVAAADGTELLFALLGPDGKEIRSGAIPAGAALLIPVDCPPKGKSTYWIYFDNPLAGQVPDFLPDRLGLVNGDLEEGEGDTPTGWVHDRPDAQHRAEWYFNQLGLRHSYTPWHFYLFGWGHPPKKVGNEAPYAGETPYREADRAALRPEYKHLFQEALRLFWDHVKQKGWADRFVL